jgi:signal transduction histidine kinase/CheY-like chemotaxis protein
LDAARWANFGTLALWYWEASWLHRLADLLVCLACLVISLFLVLHYLRPWYRRDVPYRAIVWVIAGFFLLCGSSCFRSVIAVSQSSPVARAISVATAALSCTALLTLACLVCKTQAPCDPREVEKEVADRRRTQAELTQMSARLNALLDASTQVSIIATDPAGLITLFNTGAERMLGYSAEEMIGKATPLLIHDADEVKRHAARLSAEFLARIEGFDAFVERARRGGHDVSEWTYIRKDGTRLTVLLAVTAVVDPEGRINGFLGIATDLTERKRLEDQLRKHACELAEADARKNEFLAMLGHELRNPLAPIRNAVRIMKQGALDDPGTRWAREVIDHQVRQMAQLVDDLLDVSRVTRGKVRLQKEVVDVATIVAYAVETSRPMIDANRLRLSISLPPRAINVDADPIRMAQVLSNLLNNAAKYTPEQGHIRLSLGEEGGHVVFRVRDNGIGIPPEMLSKVFDLFTQVDHSLDRSQGGLGLGLTLVRSLVELHGGNVRATSPGLGQGSEFVVNLPIYKPGKAAAARKASGDQAERVRTPLAPRPAQEPCRVLVVDDNVTSAQSLELLLRLEGHHARLVHDGPSALEAVSKHRYDVLLMDIGLPGMSGYDVARRVRQQPEVGNPLLVAVTGYAEDEARRLSREAGFDHHLVKPVDPEEILALLASTEWSEERRSEPNRESSKLGSAIS